MKRGFTIVELIIVIVVIAILASLTVLAYRSVQRGAVLSKAISELSSINGGVKIYHAKKGVYPVSPGSTWQYSCISSGTGPGSFANTVGTYIDTVPVAPCSRGVSADGTWAEDSWAYISNGTDYKLIFYRPAGVEPVKDQVPTELRDRRFSDNPAGTWGYWSAGAASW